MRLSHSSMGSTGERMSLGNFPGQAECVAPDFARPRPIGGAPAAARACWENGRSSPGELVLLASYMLAKGNRLSSAIS